MLSPVIFDTYTGRHARQVKLIQTHISWVFLAGDRVYKIKKPVDFGFLDFSTLENRREFCQAELRLNRRLCPDIYLECVPLTEKEGKFTLNGHDKIVEWVLVMKRMPEEGLMNRLLERDEIHKQDIDTIVSKLTPFYAMAHGGEEVRRAGSIENVIHNTEENFQQTENFVDKIIPKDTFDAICSYTRDFLSENMELLNARVMEGRIREGHGDLYSANICFDRAADDVYIFDCIEFNQRFRCGDVASDVAFLAMDLDHFGLPQLSEYFISSFSTSSKDPGLLKLNNFYKCYRAYVRGKIGCFTWADSGVDQTVRDTSMAQASDYFKLALRYAGAAPRARLYVFFGLSGSGKSTLANAMASRHNISVFNSDQVRKEIIAGIPATESRVEPFGQGIYSSKMSRKTYRAMSRLAGSRIVRGESAVLDATYIMHEEREKLLELAHAAGADIYFIHCRCPEDIIRARLEQRQKQTGSVSDGRWEIYLNQKKNFDSIMQLPQTVLIDIDTTLPADQALDMIEQAVPEP